MAFESVDNMAAFIRNTSLTLNTSKVENQLISVCSYLIVEDCGYLLTLKTIPNFDINYIIAKLDIESSLFTINENEKIKPINNLIAGRDYYVEMKYFNDDEKIKITLEMSYIDDIPFDYLYFSESYRKFDDIVKKIYYKDISIKKNGNIITTSFSYKANDKRYPLLFLKFTPKYDLTYFLPYFKFD